jgi:precorrin isomerase
MKTTKVLVITGGGYQYHREIQQSKEEIERVINELKPGENCCVSYDDKMVYNSNMTPLYTNGEEVMAYHRNNRIERFFEYVS